MRWAFFGIGERDLCPGSVVADGSHDQIKAASLVSNGVLHTGTGAPAGGTAGGDVGWHEFASGLGPRKLKGEVASVEQGKVADRAEDGVCPHAVRQVVRIEQPGELAAVMGGGVSGRKCADQAEAVVDADVVLIGERGQRVSGFSCLGHDDG